MKRINSFEEIYKACNNGSNKEKYLHCNKEKGLLRYIDIELTNHCNINCYMCPVGTHSMMRERGMMTMETVERICDELKKGDIQGVRCIRWGEPTLHPRFLEILQMLKKTGKAVHFNTNGTLLKRESIEKIIEMEIDSVKFSFQGIDKESYEEMRSGSSWEKLLENIYLMNKLRGDKEKPYIQISTTITDETEEQVQKFSDMADKLSDYYNIGHTELSYLDVNKMKISEEKKKRYMELKERESLCKKHLEVCPEVYDKLSINWDGTVSACCSDFDNQLLVGDIKKENLQKIFHNERMNQLRKMISENRYDELPLCSNCFEYIDLRKE